jgi:hypothetical protein
MSLNSFKNEKCFKKAVEKFKTEILCHVYEQMRKKVWYSRTGHNDTIIGRMRLAGWINKVIETHSEYVIFIASPRQQWLRERAPTFCYTYVACPFSINTICVI